MKKINILICKFALVIFLIISSTNTFGQLSKIAVVNIMDTTLFHIHYGTTIFTNKIDTFHCDFNCKKYVKRELLRFLSLKNEVSEINIPDSILAKNGSINDFWGVKKTVKQWISTYKDQFDIIIFVESSKQESSPYPGNHKLLASGLYSQGNPIKSWAAVYSTTIFRAFSTANSKMIDYDPGYLVNFEILKEYKFSKDKIIIDPEMLPLIKTQLVKILDDELENFLTNSLIVPKNIYDNMKSLKTE
jgi:hypothetical protein